MADGEGAAAAVARLLTTLDLDEDVPDPRRISMSALHQAELSDGRLVLLLDDRGWSSSGPAGFWARMSLHEIEETARTVVGPDEPAAGQTQAQALAAHWGRLAGELQRYGVTVTAAELARRPHDVVLSERLLERLSP